MTTDVTITNQLVIEELEVAAGTRRASRVRVARSLQMPISIILINVPNSISLLVKIQLPKTTKPGFDREKGLRETSHSLTITDRDLCCTITILQAIAVQFVVIWRAGYNTWTPARSDTLYDVEVGEGKGDKDRWADYEGEWLGEFHTVHQVKYQRKVGQT